MNYSPFISIRPRAAAAIRPLRLALRPLASLLALVTLAGPAAAAPKAAVARPELALGRSEMYDYDPPEPGTYSLPPLMRAGDGVVLQSDGRPERLLELMEGRLTVLSFIYTRCPDPTACPTATGALRQVHALTRDEPALARNVLLLSMSFDPAADTPEIMKVFSDANRRENEGAPWRFLTAPSVQALQPILRQYGQTINRKQDDPAERIYHPVRVYLIDRDGQVRNIYSFGMLDPRMVMTDIRTLLIEEERATRQEP